MRRISWFVVILAALSLSCVNTKQEENKTVTPTPSNTAPTPSATPSSTPSKERTELEKNRKLWSEKKPADYQYEMFRSCECLPEQSGPVVLTVKGGKLTGVKQVKGGALVPEDKRLYFRDVEGLFSLIEESLNQNKPVRISYDPTLGYPSSIEIDYPQFATDGGINLKLSNWK